jgi:hypothetical protein
MFSQTYNSYEKDKGFMAVWWRWQYLESPRLFLRIIGNFLRFTFSFFSFSLLLKTFFHPWRKYQESYGRGFDPKKFFSALSFNTISRFMGMLIRFLMLIIGGFSIIAIFFLGIAIFLLWYFSSWLILGGLAWGLYLIFQSF